MGLFKRDQVWWMRFTYKGRQIRKSTEVTDKKLAEKIHAKVLTQIAEDKWFEKPIGADKTFREMMARYDQEKFSELASGSRRGCKSYLDGLVAFFGDYSISEITPRLINDFKQMRKAQGVKPATIVRQLTVMKRAYNVAIREWEWLSDNPVSKLPPEKVKNARERWLTQEEEKKVLNACPAWLMEMVIFNLNTGLRLGEMLSLTWKGVDLFRRTITIFKSKNGEMRTVPVNQTVLGLLKTKAKIKSMKADLVFYTENHTAYHPANFRRSFNKAVMEAGLAGTGICPHVMRHTFATRLSQAGVDLLKLQKLGGWKTLSMVMRYSHHYPESLRDGVEVLDKISTNLAHSGDAGSVQIG